MNSNLLRINAKIAIATVAGLMCLTAAEADAKVTESAVVVESGVVTESIVTTESITAPELPDYLAMAFVAISGGYIVCRSRRRAQNHT